MKNVLYISHTAKPGGAMQSLKVLLHQWRKSAEGIQPLVALPRDGEMFDELRDDGWPVFELPPGPQGRPRTPAQMWRAAAKVLSQQRMLVQYIRREKVDLVHSNTTVAHLAGGLAARRCGVPAVWHVRDLASLGRWGTPLSRRADAVVAISRTVAGALENQRVPRRKIHQIYNAVDCDEWHENTSRDAAILQALHAADGSVVFGCVGQLVPWKNQGAFIEAAAILRRLLPEANIRFAVIGGDPWQQNSRYRRRLIQQAKVLGLGGELIFFPHQSDNRAMLATCDVLVHAALREPFGRVVMEAMALQKTVIAFDAAGPGEIITNEQDGLLVAPASSSGGLALAMRKVLLSPSLRHELGSNARHTVCEQFDVASHAARIKEIYEIVWQSSV